MLNIAKKVLVQQCIQKLDAIAEETQRKNKIKQTSRSQQAISCSAVSNSMGQMNPQQPVNDKPQPQPVQGQ